MLTGGDFATDMSPRAPGRPTLTSKHSLPAFRDYHAPSRSVSAGQWNNTTTTSSPAALFQNPNPFANSIAAGPAPPFAFDTPVSPLAAGIPPPSPSSASPPPISQSLLYGHGMHVPARAVQHPIPPGPLPEPTFSFGDPSSSPALSSSSASSSPPSDHSTVVEGPPRRDSADSVGSLGALEEGDDASAGSSAYESMSRFGSFASDASASSYTTYFSDGSSQGNKPDTLDAPPDEFDPARRGSL